jgi:hypothetical protein
VQQITGGPQVIQQPSVMIQAPSFMVQPSNVVISQQPSNFSSNPKPSSGTVILPRGSRTMISESPVTNVTTGQVVQRIPQISSTAIHINQAQPVAKSLNIGRTQTAHSVTNQVQQPFPVSQQGEIQQTQTIAQSQQAIS